MTQIKCYEGHYVALARFIDNDYVKARLCWIKVLDHSRERHDPDRDGAPALRHLVGRLRTQTRRPYAGALADLSYGVEPADESLPLEERGPPCLKHPGAIVNEVNRRGLQLARHSLDGCLKLIDRHARPAVQFIVDLTPGPGLRGVSGHGSARVRAVAQPNCGAPSRGGGLKLCQQNIATLQIASELVQFQQPGVASAVGPGIQRVYCLAETRDGMGICERPNCDPKTLTQLGKLLVNLDPLQVVTVRREYGRKGVLHGPT